MASMMLLSRCEREKRSRVHTKQTHDENARCTSTSPFLHSFHFIFLVKKNNALIRTPRFGLPLSSFPRFHNVRALLVVVVTVVVSEGGVRGLSVAPPSLPLVPSVVGLVLIDGHLV